MKNNSAPLEGYIHVAPSPSVTQLLLGQVMDFAYIIRLNPNVSFDCKKT